MSQHFRYQERPLSAYGRSDAVGSGPSVGKHHLSLAIMLRAPFFLVVFFRVQVGGGGVSGEEGRQEKNNEAFIHHFLSVLRCTFRGRRR